MNEKPMRGKIRSRKWWALVESPSALPVIYATREQAESDAMPNERLARVVVEAASPRDMDPRFIKKSISRRKGRSQ